MALIAAACGGGGGGSAASPLSSVGPGEGTLNLIAWIGYTEDGSTDKNYDWVTPFEQQSGCQVTVKYDDTSDQMVNDMRQSGGTAYDGVSASGDASNRLIAAGDVAPINVDLIPGWKDFLPTLQSPPNNTVDGVHYGVSYMFGPNVLMYNTQQVTPAPTSWDVVFDPNTPYAGKLTIYTGAIYIADAAMYLKTHNPDLGITDPYELTQDQFNAAIELLKGQQPNVIKYWGATTDQIDLFTSGESVVGDGVAVPGEHPARRQAAGRCGHPQRRSHWLGRHVDDVGQREAPELHVQVDAVGIDGRRPVTGSGILRSHARQPAVVRQDRRGPGRGCGSSVPLWRRRLREEPLPLEDAPGRLREREDGLHGLLRVAAGVDGGHRLERRTG
jgi:hypothetical protein